MRFEARAVLFDLDGTLVDSAPDLTVAVNAARQSVGMVAVGVEDVRRWLGNGAQRLVHRALTNDAAEMNAPAERFDVAWPVFLETYQRHVCEASSVYPGGREALESLVSRGYRLGCVTNKPERFTRDLLEKLKLDRFFEVTVAGDTLPVKKPDPAPLLHALGRLGAEPVQAMMVGDSVTDVKAARAAGSVVICVSYGYNHGLDIRAAGPDAVIDSLAQLGELLR
ncbi:MAG: phosphoglycolate phosphatase [Pseudomonadota bacterium]|nr:phosphoglycolate phosphatase [Pseudomonadota bacterium]